MSGGAILVCKPMDYSPEVIVVEDNQMVLEALVDHLQSEGFRVRGVETGQALDAALAVRLADALVLDLNLPFADGISIAKRIRRALPGIGILILSARVQPRDRVDGYESGADVYLPKPVSPQELTLALRTLCSRVARLGAT